MLQRFLAKLSFSSKQGKNNAPLWSVKNQHLLNNMNEIQLLNGHTDIVRLLVRIDASRCVEDLEDWLLAFSRSIGAIYLSLYPSPQEEAVFQ